MKKFLILLILLSGLILSAEFSLVVSIPAGGEATYNQLFPTYFDPNNPEEQPDLFRVNVENQDPIVEHHLVFNMSWRGNILLQDVIITPREFTNSYTIENQDIIIEADTGVEFDVDTSAGDDMWDQNDEFKDLLLSTGRFPDGVYEFTLEAIEGTSDDSGLSLDMVSATITITSPAPITLISPGRPFGMSPAESSDQNPTFVWFSNLDEYTLKVFDLSESEAASQEEVELLDPIMTETGITETNFSCSSPLEFGKTYGWQITSSISSPLTEKLAKSEVYTFSLVSGETTNYENDQIILFLQQLNRSEAEEGIELLNSGFNYNHLEFDGRSIPLDELNNILMRISSNDLAVEAITIE